MVSALTILFLGCWLALWSEVSGKLPAPRPSISVSPSWVIVPGAAVTIHCQCQCEARKLFLYKDGIQIKELDAGARDEFTIPSASRGDTGFYSCRSHSSSEPPTDPHHYMWIVVAELSYPKPSISLSPRGEVALGGTVIVRCECRCQNATALMYKLGNSDVRRWAEIAGGVAEFTIDNVSWRDTGSYSCQYGTKSDPSVWSHPSDPVELIVTEGTDLAGPQQPDPCTTEPEGEGGTDPTQLGTPPDPTRPGSTWPDTGAGGRKLPSTSPETDYTQGNIVRLALGTGVLLALALILAEAAPGWRWGRC